MKYLFFAAFLVIVSACNNSRKINTPVTDRVSFKVINNSLLPHQYTIIGYEPGNMGSNWTNGLFLLPGTFHTFNCLIGTKIYVASKKQVGTVMGGGSIYDNPPLLTVKAEDAGKKFRLN